ncbi:MAG: LTA synthase family protein [Prolixibacteraceae bacterium]
MKRFELKKYTINEYLVFVYHFLILLVIYSLCRVLFFAFNSAMFPNVTLQGFGRILLGGLRFDISALFYINILYLVFALLPTPWNHSRAYQLFLKWIFIVPNSIGIALNVIDFKYYPFILRRTTYNVADILKNEENLGRLFFRFVLDYWYFFLLWIGLVLLLIVLFERVKSRRTIYKKKWQYYPAGIFVLLLSSAIAIVGMRGNYQHSTRPITLSNAGDYVSSPEEVAIVLNTPFSILRTFGKKSYTKMDFFTNEDELNQLFNPVVMANDTAQMNNKNVVVIILESFSREFFGCFNDSLDGKPYDGYTPFLDSLAGQSLVFPNAFANGYKSIDALPSIAASLPALVLPYVISEYSSNKVNSLASLLKDYGYQSSFYHGAPNGSMGFSAFTNLAGFDRYVGKNEFNDDRFYDGIWGIWDEEFFQFYAQQLTLEQKPFVSLIFSVSSHHPYQLPERYKEVFPEGELPLYKCLSYTDYSLKRFFETASKEAWFKNTLFVLTADHSIYSIHHDYRNNMNTFAIPLIFYTPDGSLKGVDERLAQQIDIMPTVLNYLNYPGCYVSFGNNLLNNNKETFAINYLGDSYQFMMNDYLIQFDGQKVSADYNYKKDPQLKNKLRGKEDYQKELNKMKAIIEQYNNRMIRNDLICR